MIEDQLFLFGYTHLTYFGEHVHVIPSHRSAQTYCGKKVLGLLVQSDYEPFSFERTTEIVGGPHFQWTVPGDSWSTPKTVKVEAVTTPEPKFHKYMNEMAITVEREYERNKVQYIVGTDKKGRRFNVPKEWLQTTKPEPGVLTAEPPDLSTVVVCIGGDQHMYQRRDSQATLPGKRWFYVSVSGEASIRRVWCRSWSFIKDFDPVLVKHPKS